VSRGLDDQYSDIDLKVITANIDVFIENLMMRIKADDGCLITALILKESPNSAAYTLATAIGTVYQKVDIEVNDSSELQDSHLIYMSSKTTAHRNGDAIKPSRRTKTLASVDKDHEVVDVLLGSLRYLKYRKRGDEWAAYKFYKGFIEQYIKNKLQVDSLSLDTYKRLDLVSFPTEILYPRSFKSMDKLYGKYLQKMLMELKKLQPQTMRYIDDVLAEWQYLEHS
jgi:hypothetical protein